MRRVVKLLVAVDLVILLAVVAVWLVARSGDDRANAVNAGLRGSLPPAGQSWPDELASIDSITPPMPRASNLAGHPAVLLVTCIECRSGDIMGGFLGRIQPSDLPADAPVHVLTFDGDQAAWQQRYSVRDDDQVVLHHASTAAAADRIRARLGIGSIDGAEESGVTFVYDPDGTWRASYSIGQLNLDDLAHDLDALGD